METPRIFQVTVTCVLYTVAVDEEKALHLAKHQLLPGAITDEWREGAFTAQAADPDSIPIDDWGYVPFGQDADEERDLRDLGELLNLW